MSTEDRYVSRMALSTVDLAMADTAQHLIEVTLRISPQGAYRVYDEFADSMIAVNEDGSYTVRGEFTTGLWLDSYLLSFGTLLVEINPESLRKRMLSQVIALKINLESGSTNGNR